MSPTNTPLADARRGAAPPRTGHRRAGERGRCTPGLHVMGLSCRMFLLDQDDALYGLPNTKFEQMLRDPTSHRLPRFAGARVRMAEVVVELLDRQAIRVIWTTFGLLTFDDEGCFDPSAFDRHQRARAELALAPPLAVPGSAATVVDAASRFVAQGGVGRRLELWRVLLTRLPWGE